MDDVRVYDQALTAAEVQALLAPITQTHNGDFDQDGDVDGADFSLWQSAFPTSPGWVAAVPEPTGLMIASTGGLLALVGRRKFAR